MNDIDYKYKQINESKKKIQKYEDEISNSKKLINGTNDTLHIMRKINQELEEYYDLTDRTSTSKSRKMQNTYYRNLNSENLSKIEQSIDDNNDYFEKNIRQVEAAKEKEESDLKNKNN